MDYSLDEGPPVRFCLCVRAFVRETQRYGTQSPPSSFLFSLDFRPAEDILKRFRINIVFFLSSSSLPLSLFFFFLAARSVEDVENKVDKCYGVVQVYED